MRLTSFAFASLVVPLMLLAFGASIGHAGPSEDLAKLCHEYWEGHLRANPTSATSIGDRRFDDRLADVSAAGIARNQRRIEGLLAKARAFDEKALSPADRVSLGALRGELEGQLAQIACGFHEWVVDPLEGPQVSFMNLADYTVIESPKDAANYVARCRAMGPYLDAYVVNLRTGLAKEKAASRDAVRKVVDQLRQLQSKPVTEWALLAPAAAAHDSWPKAEREGFRRDLTTVVEQTVKPAFARTLAFLEADILPRSRGQEKPGLVGLPDGLECYRSMIRVHTSLDKTPDELHQIGLREVAEFRKRLAVVGKRVFGTDDVAEIQKRLRTDPAMHFKNAEEIEAKARESLARAEAAAPNWFATLPKARCEVKVMGMHEAPYSTVAYYREPTMDGSRPGAYMINTYQPETRPRYEAQALAFHESVPGHHLQIAIAQELTGIPAFRKYQGVTAFVEGWALYTERLADEMKLYSSDTDRIGMLSYDAWRSCRLVVDTGIHAMGWSRQQAIDYMVANSVLAENNIVNEVDRYITWPGQALAYKVGQLEILELREKARARLGNRFDIAAFHDAVLRNGAVSLPVLRQQIDDYCTYVERSTQ